MLGWGVFVWGKHTFVLMVAPWPQKFNSLNFLIILDNNVIFCFQFRPTLMFVYVFLWQKNNAFHLKSAVVVQVQQSLFFFVNCLYILCCWKETHKEKPQQNWNGSCFHYFYGCCSFFSYSKIWLNPFYHKNRRKRGKT
jgi:uncharacterized membrane protein YozB (DUF420 family)